MAVAGIANVGDSLAAIKKKLVFEDKKLTMGEIMDACRKNFKGKEEIRQMLLNAPKFGNDIDYVDYITADALGMAYKESQKI